jgi:hypothetical protein
VQAEGQSSIIANRLPLAMPNAMERSPAQMRTTADDPSCWGPHRRNADIHADDDVAEEHPGCDQHLIRPA